MLADLYCYVYVCFRTEVYVFPAMKMGNNFFIVYNVSLGHIMYQRRVLAEIISLNMNTTGVMEEVKVRTAGTS